MANTSLRLDYLPTRIENQTDYFTITAGDTPVRNVVSTSKDNEETETWSGWLKVEVPSERPCRITALVDDNGSFTINGVTTEIPEDTHGARRYTPEKTVTLKPGYYFVTCRMQDLPPINQSYPNVKHFQAFIKWDEGGSEVTQQVTQLYDITERGARDITIVITGEQTGSYDGARSFPHTILVDDDSDSPQLYSAPVYKMYLRGRNDSGEAVEEAFEVIRFMPGYNPDPDENDTCKKYKEWPVLSMTGLAQTQSINTSYKTYELHGASEGSVADNGAFVLSGDTFLLHDGPDGEHESGWGAFGCSEVYGSKGMSALKESIANMSGIVEGSVEDKIRQLCSQGKIYIHIEGTTRPSIVEVN